MNQLTVGKMMTPSMGSHMRVAGPANSARATAMCATPIGLPALMSGTPLRRTTSCAMRQPPRAKASGEDVAAGADSKGEAGVLSRSVASAMVAVPAALLTPGIALAHEGPAVDPTSPTFLAQLGLVGGMLALGQYFAVQEEKEHAEKEAAAATAAASAAAAAAVARSLDSGDEDEEEGEKDVDIWRDTPIRYLGYSNELGEAFRPLVGGAANLTYIVAIGYVMCDAWDKTQRAKGKSLQNRAADVFRTLDTGGEGYLTYDEVRAAFRDLRVPLTSKQVDNFIASADVKKNNRIDFDEFILSIERADFELGLLLDAGEADGKYKADMGPAYDKYSILMGLDALFWQITASVAMPGFAINRVVSLVDALTEEGSFIPTVVGLAMIPFVVKPLDVLADVLLDATLRPLVFASIDVDGNKFIELDELRKKLNERPEDLPDEVIVQLLNTMDLNEDGKVSMEEWANGGFDKYMDWVDKHQNGELTETGLV